MRYSFAGDLSHLATSKLRNPGEFGTWKDNSTANLHSCKLVGDLSHFATSKLPNHGEFGTLEHPQPGQIDREYIAGPSNAEIITLGVRSR